jgi:hypothetical protein
MPETFAPDSQTWWDAVCNCTPENKCHARDETILSDKQYHQYWNTVDTLEVTFIADMNPEERFMFYCFMSYEFDPS